MAEIKPRETVHQQRPDKGDDRGNHPTTHEKSASPKETVAVPAKVDVHRASVESPGLPRGRAVVPRELRKEAEVKLKSVNIQATLLGLYRGTSYNLRGLSLEDKASLLAALDADSRAEMVHKHPPREQIRENTRKLLK